MSSSGSASRRAGAVVALAAAAGLAGCAESMNPMPGALQVGARGEAFRVPALRTERAPFRYPDRAWREGVGGEVRLRIHIDRTGEVDSAYVLESSGHPALDSAALADARRLRYRPARRGSEAVGVWAVLPVRYPMPEKADPRPREEP